MNLRAGLPATLAAWLLGVCVARGAEPSWSVTLLGCDSLRLSGRAAGWDWLEAETPAGFLELGAVGADGAVDLQLGAPPRGGSLVLRPARLDSLGLPDYGDEWIWNRALPRLEARLEGRRLVGRVQQDGRDGCPLPDLILRLEHGGQLTDLQRLPAGSSFELDLAGRAFSALTLDWGGLGKPLRLAGPDQPAAPALAGPVEDAAPAAPEWAGFAGEALELLSPWPLVLLQGTATLENAGAGRWRVTATGTDELLVAARDDEGRTSLPFRWESGAAALRLDVRRTGPGSLQISARDAVVPPELELVWLDGQGRQGRAPLPAAGLTLEGLAGVCRLQALGPQGPLWKQSLDLSWPAPGGLRLSSASDTLLTATLEDERGWSGLWELEWRAAGVVTRRPPAAAHAFALPATERLHLRWRAGSPPSQSRWSAWREISLTPEPPAAVDVRPAPGGLELNWEPREWLAGQLEIERVLGADTLRWRVPEAPGSWLDPLPGDRLARYRLRSRLTRHQSDWTTVWGARPLEDLPAGTLARRSVSVAEVRAFSRETGTALPAAVEWVEGRAARPADDQPALGLSPREALRYCNWLNARLGLDGRYDESAAWQAGTKGGYRLPGTPAEATGAGRVWLAGAEGVRAAGSSGLRSGSSRRPYSLDARQPDVGLCLIWSPPAR
ncbi:MAG: hypothetical protein WC326_14435 [Candidatus Delongbacteria bacterium]